MSKFTNVLDRFEYEDLMQWDKDDLVHSIIDYQHQIGSKQRDIEHLLKCIEKLMKKNNNE